MIVVVVYRRIRTESNGGAWCPKDLVKQESKEYLEINLKSTHVITFVETQGRFGNGQGKEFAENYILDYWRPQLNEWIRFKNRSGSEVSSSI